MNNISDKEQAVKDRLQESTQQAGHINPHASDVDRAAFLAISRLAVAAERMADALEALNERDRSRYYSSSDQRNRD